MHKTAARAALLALFVAISGPALGAAERLSVIFGERTVGTLIADTSGGETRIVYDHKNNGRGPTIAETIRIDRNGLPTSWTVSGTTTFGSRVSEAFSSDGKTATWTDSTGKGIARLEGPAIYVAQAASPWALGLYARAILAAGGPLPALPGGELKLEHIGALDITGPAGTGNRSGKLPSPFNANNGAIVETEAAAVEAVRAAAARGVFQIKIYNSINPAWVPAMIAEAKRLNLRAAGHIPAFTTTDLMLEAGYDEITHSNQMMLNWAFANIETPQDDKAYRGAFDTKKDLMRRLHKAGVLLVPGTDMGGSFWYHRELELFEQAGLTRAEVVKRATADMAVYLALEDRFGRIATGMTADIVLLPGDPLADIKAVKASPWS